MNTTYKPIDPEFLHMLAGAKARGLSWTRLAELSKIPVGELEVIPWREPKEWAKASRYAEKLVAHEVLAEMVSSLRFQMNDPVNNGRLKTQVANSLVRVIQQQHALRTPNQPKKATRPPLKPITPPTPEPLAPIVNEPIETRPTPPSKSPPSTTPLATVATVLLMFLCGLFLWRISPTSTITPPAVTDDVCWLTDLAVVQPDVSEIGPTEQPLHGLSEQHTLIGQQTTARNTNNLRHGLCDPPNIMRHGLPPNAFNGRGYSVETDALDGGALDLTFPRRDGHGWSPWCAVTATMG